MPEIKIKSEKDYKQAADLFFNGCDVNVICEQFLITPHQLIEWCNHLIDTENMEWQTQSNLNVESLIQANSDLECENAALKAENIKLKNKAELVSKIENLLIQLSNYDK